MSDHKTCPLWYGVQTCDICLRAEIERLTAQLRCEEMQHQHCQEERDRLTRERDEWRGYCREDGFEAVLAERDRLAGERDAAEARIRRWQDEHDVIEQLDSVKAENARLAAERTLLVDSMHAAMKQRDDAWAENARLLREKEQLDLRAGKEVLRLRVALEAAERAIRHEPELKYAHDIICEALRSQSDLGAPTESHTVKGK